MLKNHIKNRIDLLEEHIRDISQKTTVNSVSDNSFFSYRHANRLFKSIKGESINSFANKIRIQTAAEYLKYTSNSIFDIALEVGYESTAAFSKAFKKIYEKTPSDFRKTNTSNQLPQTIGETYYQITHFQQLEIYTLKTTITQESSFDVYFQNTKRVFNEIDTENKQCILLWEEDPELSTLADSRYFVGVNAVAVSSPKEPLHKITIEGKYAIFDTTYLKESAYEIWHELTCLFLELESKSLRSAPYIEWFSDTAFHNKDTFIPYQIAVPIQ